ncbi:RecB family exonuclease [Streptomyces sp. NPDC001705]
MSESTISPPDKPLHTHTSFSAKETLERCARSYFLKYFAKAPKRPALWSVGGSAVHETTEFYDLLSFQHDPDLMAFELAGIWEACFQKQLDAAFAKEPNENLWGRSKSEPIDVWRQQGLQFVQSYIDWRERSPWEIWTTPDDKPAIELDVSGTLPGCPVEIKGYVDRVFWDPVFKKLVVLDLKSGKRPPKSAAQFETYAALLAAKYGVSVDLGVPFLNRRGTVGKVYDLSEVTPESVGAVYGAAWEQVQEYVRAGSWPATTGDCFICDVQAACAAVNGPLATYYDPASPGFEIPF